MSAKLKQVIRFELGDTIKGKTASGFISDVGLYTYECSYRDTNNNEWGSNTIMYSAVRTKVLLTEKKILELWGDNADRWKINLI